MAKVKVFDMAGKALADMDLADSIFGIEPASPLCISA